MKRSAPCRCPSAASPVHRVPMWPRRPMSIRYWPPAHRQNPTCLPGPTRTGHNRHFLAPRATATARFPTRGQAFRGNLSATDHQSVRRAKRWILQGGGYQWSDEALRAVALPPPVRLRCYPLQAAWCHRLRLRRGAARCQPRPLVAET